MSRTLFLADDSVTIQRVVELTFAHEDIRVVSVSDGRKAVQWLESEKPDIILLDIELPELNGFDIAARVRKSPRLRHVPILLLAGAFEAVDEERARTVGTDGVIKKPFEPEQLVTRVKELLSLASPSRPEPTRTGGLRQAPAVGTAGLELVGTAAVATMPRAMEMESNGFSALFAAEQTSPAAVPAQTTAVIISESAIEDAVRRVLAKMTDEMVHRIVLDTAERLIREELEKIRQEPE